MERGKHRLVDLWQNISLLNLRITAVGQWKPWSQLVALQTNVLAALAIPNFPRVYALPGLSGAGQRIAIAVVKFTNFGGAVSVVFNLD